MQVGDLVRLRGGVYRNFLDGEYLIYMGDGSWAGWLVSLIAKAGH